MAERPDAMTLLEAAQAVVVGELLPLAGDEGRLPSLMVAKAISIALRELRVPEAERLAAEHDLLAAALPEQPDATPEDLRDRLRAGPLTGEVDTALRAALIGCTRARLAVSNPKLLATLDTLYGSDEDAPA